ncbi:MAG TPA: ATP-binding protein, partial [Chitinophagaceae bacterium]|nr:ATP-binding protein [Chitinophagaceae bacterium]
DNLWTCGFVLCEKDRAEDEWWLSTESGFIPAFYLPNVGDVTHYNIYKGWLEGEEYHTEQLEGEALQEHYDWLMNIPIAKKIFDDLAVAGIERPKWQKLHCAYFSKGYLCIITQVPCPDEIIFRRFAQVFDLTYTRFLDLQKAEAQTREALIEGALERVRARALAMQQPEELKDVAQVLRNEMGALGVEELETSSIYIHGDSSENVECWYALQDPKHTEKKMVSDHFLLNLDDTWVGREMENFYHSNEKQTSVVMQGANRREWIEYCYKHSPVFSGFYGATIPDRTYHLYKFSHGYIGAAAPGDISAESWRLLSRAASVFSLAYSRFKDLSQARNDLIKLKEEKKRAEDALTELQATQKQLIQSEKMASLGELTAGIAHEIQNPLNFVNNFSEVSSELVDEMREELANGNQQLANEIANDLKQNLEKINHHGKRADVIVKGMLQHSRSSSGQKEPTDINALTDEYLRLAYHGLRAKDKSFNATMETDFDETIGKINIVPQDIGRVILNLITNAFYAVTEKKTLRQVQDGYEPTVSVSTKKLNDKVEVKVRDNGNGIPQKVLDKIFQPFFTTKPTGQGTGLGLSLSYDIVKAHGGEIRVDTKENEGTEFTIQLPMI